MIDVARLLDRVRARDPRSIARAISLVEDRAPAEPAIHAALDDAAAHTATVLGVTGPGGAGKSTLTDRLVDHHRAAGRRVGVVAIDPSSPLSGGALLGDRVRMMRHATDPDVVVRSMATRGRIGGVCAAAGATVRILTLAGCDPILIETVGVGQAEIDIVRLADLTLLVLAPGLGDDIQAMKAGLAEVADVFVVNKMDAPGAEALVLDLEPVARQRGRALCCTCAGDGRGVAALADTVAARCAAHRASGDLARRRAEACRAEALDWALELLRPTLAELLDGLGPLRGDPHLAARRLLPRLSSVTWPTTPPESRHEQAPILHHVGRTSPRAGAG